MNTARLQFVLLSSLALSACSDDFTPFAELDRLRVLAIRAQNPTLTSSGALSSTSIVPLVYRSDDSTPLSYAWSWCPAYGGAALGYRCLIDESQLAALAQAGGVTLPDDFSFQLSTTATASFSYPLPSATLRQLCDSINNTELPQTAALPDCEQGMEIAVNLTVTQGEAQVRAIKQILLQFDAADMNGKVQNPPNENPSIRGVYYLDPAEPDTLHEWTGEPEFTRGVEYGVLVQVPIEDAESYVEYRTQTPDTPTETREYLAITWLSEAGGFEFTRTGYTSDAPESKFPELMANTWTIPKTDDYASDETVLYFVLRDDRGGQTWIEKRARLR